MPEIKWWQDECGRNKLPASKINSTHIAAIAPYFDALRPALARLGGGVETDYVMYNCFEYHAGTFEAGTVYIGRKRTTEELFGKGAFLTPAPGNVMHFSLQQYPSCCAVLVSNAYAAYGDDLEELGWRIQLYLAWQLGYTQFQYLTTISRYKASLEALGAKNVSTILNRRTNRTIWVMHKDLIKSDGDIDNVLNYGGKGKADKTA